MEFSFRGLRGRQFFNQLVWPTEKRLKGTSVMTDYQKTQNVGMSPMSVNVTRANYPVRANKPMDSDIEVIDLDNPRDQIKPTTWHG